MKLALSIFIIVLCFYAPTRADEAPQRVSSRQKSIDFDDSLVEGMNKRPLDHLSQLSDRDRKNQQHLYRKRAGFRDENERTIRLIRFQP